MQCRLLQLVPWLVLSEEGLVLRSDPQFGGCFSGESVGCLATLKFKTTKIALELEGNNSFTFFLFEVFLYLYMLGYVSVSV